MKILIKTFPVLLILLSLSSAYGVPDRDNRFIVDAIIRQLFELLRNIISNGSEEKNIPVLDPYRFHELSFETLESLSTNTQINITKGEFTGLASFDLQQFNFSRKEISIEVKLHFPKLFLKSDYYEMDGSILDTFIIKGKGKMHFEVHNVLLTGKFYLKQSENGRTILLKMIKNMGFNIESISSDTEFDKNIDEIINAMIEDIGSKYLTKFSKVITLMYGPNLLKLLNSMLIKFENWNLIAAIL